MSSGQEMGCVSRPVGGRVQGGDGTGFRLLCLQPIEDHGKRGISSSPRNLERVQHDSTVLDAPIVWDPTAHMYFTHDRPFPSQTPSGAIKTAFASNKALGAVSVNFKAL
jgi:hypothetical protein